MMAVAIRVPGKCGSLVDDGRLHPVADAGDMVMMVVMHEVMHGAGSCPGTDSGRQQ